MMSGALWRSWRRGEGVQLCLLAFRCCSAYFSISPKPGPGALSPPPPLGCLYIYSLYIMAVIWPLESLISYEEEDNPRNIFCAVVFSGENIYI